MTERRLIHYSSAPLGKLRPIAQLDKPFMKPKGLWVSAEGKDDWLNWCQEEQFQLGDLLNATQIVLKPEAKILRLTSAAQIEEFTEKHACALKGMDDYPNLRRHLHCVRWKEVAADYQGIVIAPYCWALRLEPHTAWYYGWDCASGCIWDSEAIAQTRPLEWKREDGLNMTVGYNG